MKITAKNNICSQLVKYAAVALDIKMLFVSLERVICFLLLTYKSSSVHCSIQSDAI